MTELLVRKEEALEELKLQRLEGFLRKHGADDIIPKIQGMPLEKALEKVVRIGSDELVNELLNENPWVLEYESVAEAIAWSRNYEIFKSMVEKYRDVLKYPSVAQVVARYGDNKECKYMINKYPEVLKYPGVAEAIAEFKDDETCKYMIEKYPGVPDETICFILARTNKLKALTYILLKRGEIKPNEVELTTLQFSMVLGELDNYDKERLINRLFLNETAIGYKELDSVGLIYHVLLGMLNVSKESAERLAKELSKAEGNVRKALPLRGLAYALSHKGLAYALAQDSSEILNLFIKNSRSVMDALNIFPTVYELCDIGIINTNEFRQILNSEDKEAELSKLLTQKVEHAFNVKLKSDDAKNAILDYDFIEDLFVLSIKYHEYNKEAENVLINAIKYYFEGGIEGFKKFKFGHTLAKEQLSDAYAVIEKLINLDKLAVTYTGKHSISYDSIKDKMDNFMQQRNTLLRTFEKVEHYANGRLSQIIAKSTNSELTKLLEAKDLDSLTYARFDESLKRSGIFWIKLLKAGDSVKFVSDMVNELDKISEKSKEEQEIQISEIAKKVAKWTGKGLPPLGELKRYISKVNKQQPNMEELSISVNALDNAISIINVLLNYNKQAKGATITAQITFDPSKILTFGRYGKKGEGNCQSSRKDVSYNQTLMSMLGDANQFMIIFYKDNDTKPLGFMQVHLLKSNKGMIFFMERPYTNEQDKVTKMEEAARMLAQKIKGETGFDCYTYGDVGDKLEKLEVRIPSSHVDRYIDFTKALKGSVSFDCEILDVKCLTSDPLFGLKR